MTLELAIEPEINYHFVSLANNVSEEGQKFFLIGTRDRKKYSIDYCVPIDETYYFGKLDKKDIALLNYKIGVITLYKDGAYLTLKGPWHKHRHALITINDLIETNGSITIKEYNEGFHAKPPQP